jgi:hypothetical protein
MCLDAARFAANEVGVPLSVLLAISLTETGRTRGGQLEPWAWTVNMEGAGHWFDDFHSAKTFVDREFARGARSFDVGCFQINYRWHGEQFSSVDEMFEPRANALYAAKFLRSLYREKGNWPDAAGAYHSRTAVHANRYKARFNQLRTEISDQPQLAQTAQFPEAQIETVVPTSAPRENWFPLIQQRSSARTPGSLVSLSDGS